ncbi:enoyl-CoA hydratase [Ectothiorhodospira haloalkaliphila]|uniref:Enoyl-CoA hydratase n=1 Tax=Ectothiorhodospira haloalkaliphila TaxID=421628 RepID=W8KXS4_9GAMM|nr:enoyl-CoA hydratase/isomerase family protein [Ectothiorhodospira haloalkaliphila]AHK80356.1 enoyl-CoA hydratase [Ectothiorhodospira haloalkaliphila]MCG5524587.1 enoyl-CoA hydratase/isomerase family protein [Ectothiorhodospira haloalkaliphila]
MANDMLLVHAEAGVATITLNRPDRHNAFDDALIGELTRTLVTLEQDLAVRAVVLTGAGKSFSAGADIHWMKRMVDYSEEENHRDALALGQLMDTLYRLDKPTVACVNGAAMGGGVGLVAACDVALAAPRARFCLSEVRLGLIPATISPYVIAAMGERQARRYFTTAELFDAECARQMGLVHEVAVDEADLDQILARLLEQLTQNGPQAMSAAKALVRDVAGQPIDAGLLEETATRIARIRVSGEGQEGLGAFLEKRSPVWPMPGAA